MVTPLPLVCNSLTCLPRESGILRGAVSCLSFLTIQSIGFQADDDRDKAIEAYKKSIQLYKASDNPEEVEAARIPGKLMGSQKNLAKQNYEAETLGIDKLVSDLESPKYSAQVALLNIGKYVDRMKVTFLIRPSPCSTLPVNITPI